MPLPSALLRHGVPAPASRCATARHPARRCACRRVPPRPVQPSPPSAPPRTTDPSAWLKAPVRRKNTGGRAHLHRIGGDSSPRSTASRTRCSRCRCISPARSTPTGVAPSASASSSARSARRHVALGRGEQRIVQRQAGEIADARHARRRDPPGRRARHTAQASPPPAWSRPGPPPTGPTARPAHRRRCRRRPRSAPRGSYRSSARPSSG